MGPEAKDQAIFINRAKALSGTRRHHGLDTE
jgi:hypothetical protein